MASVTFPAGVGGDGSTVTDDSNATTGLANGGHRTRFVPALAQVVAVAQNTVTKATEAAASAVSAVNAPGTNATSTSSVAIGTGSKSFTIQTGKAFVVGQFVVAADTSAPSTNYMVGQITAHNSGTGALTINATMTAGSGTLTAWTISLSGPPSDVTLSGTQTFTNKTLGSGTVIGAAVTGSDNLFTRVMLQDTGWDFHDSGTTNALDYVNGSVQRWAPNTGAQTLTISNWPPSGAMGELLIQGVNLGAATITWPTINWIKNDGTTTTTFSSNGVTLQASGTDWVFLWTRDGGTTIFGKVVR